MYEFSFEVSIARCNMKAEVRRVVADSEDKARRLLVNELMVEFKCVGLFPIEIKLKLTSK